MQARRVSHGLILFTIALAVALGTGASRSALSQDRAAEFAPRKDMIDAIFSYAFSGGCPTLRRVFGTLADSFCNSRHPDKAIAHMFALGLLGSLRDEALIEICKRHKIRECGAEASRGRPILTLLSAVALFTYSRRATWSPDSRFLLVGLPKGEMRLLDVSQGTLRNPSIPSSFPAAVTWSPDGRYIALSDRRPAHARQKPSMGSVRLYSSSSLHEVGVMGGSKEECRDFAPSPLGLAPASAAMAFAADSKALWVTCFSVRDGTAKAIKLKVPGLEIEDSIVLAPPGPDWLPGFTPDGMVQLADDLILAGRFNRFSPSDPKAARTAVQLYSLIAKQPLHPPIVLDTGPGTKWTDSPRLTDDLTGVYAGADELWSTKTGERIATGVKSNGRYLNAPNRLPKLGMHIESRMKESLRGALVVLDSASGATLQEIGPIPKAEKVLVSPDGSTVAVFGHHVIRFYHVNPDAARAPSDQGR